jgi:glutamate-1-semialdehyde aminotransferase
MPGAEQVVFAKHGSDACGAAVRLARALTGRDLVLAGGYHGFHDWFAATLPGRGVPAACAEQVETFALDDLDGLERLVRARGAETAAIILEPAHRVVPTAAGLRRVRELANRCGALLIFDEVVTAFRIHLGGAQARYGVVPDLTCLGKAMANGYPLSALAGSREVMAGMRDVYFSMTYQTDSLGFVVARACLHHLAAASVPDRLEETGEAFRAAFDGAARRHGLPARALGFAARLDFDFPAADGLDAAGQRRIFLQSLVEDGLLPSGSILVSEAHRDEDVAIAEESFDRALGRIAAARRTGTAQSAERVP